MEVAPVLELVIKVFCNASETAVCDAEFCWYPGCVIYTEKTFRDVEKLDACS